MKLDRNINPDGTGKYALVLLRNIPALHPANAHQIRRIEDALSVLREFEILDFGDRDENEFFVIRLKDANACPALRAYANAAFQNGDDEFANEVQQLADKAEIHPFRKLPD